MPVSQMLARPGIVQTDIALVVADETIATFSVKFYVNRAPADGTEPRARDYYKVANLDQINAALAELQSDMTCVLHEIRFIEVRLGLVPETKST